MLDFLCVFDILISVMRNLSDLKEQLQEDIITWHEGLDNNYAYPHLDKIICDHGHAPNNWNDIDTLCQIVVDRIKELKNDNPTLN